MHQISERSIPTASFDPTYFSALVNAEERHFWFHTRNQVIAGVVRRVVVGLVQGYRVLEVGCGNGNTLRQLEETCRNGTVIGMDLFSEGLQVARRRTSCSLVQGDMVRPPFGCSFELIGLFDVLEHLQYDREILGSLNQMLAPGGALLLTVPAYPSLWSYFDEVSHHCRRYTRQDLETKLRQTGYEVEYTTYFMATLFLPVWLKRRLTPLLDRFRPFRSDRQNLEAELRIIPGLNEGLTRFLAWESLLISRRKQISFGTSLLILARKIPK